MAQRCQQLGQPSLADAHSRGAGASRVQRAIDTVLDQRRPSRRAWTGAGLGLEVIAGREQVLDRVLALARPSA
jgi:hypothetical protein